MVAAVERKKERAVHEIPHGWGTVELRLESHVLYPSCLDRRDPH
jgi:hypothetical protein